MGFQMESSNPMGTGAGSTARRRTPKEIFSKFLSTAQDQMWVDQFQWFSFDSFGELRAKLGSAKLSEINSRTHKKAPDGKLWCLEIEGFEGSSVGIDLEFICERPIFKNPQWFMDRLGIRKNPGPVGLLEEWSQREAAFKALWPLNESLTVSQFRKIAPGVFSVEAGGSEQSVQVKSYTHESWILSLAWRLVK